MDPEPGSMAAAAVPAALDATLKEAFVLPLLEQLGRGHRQAERGERRRPLIALNGPVGAGKSTLGRQLEDLGRKLGLLVIVASIDNLYLTWPQRGERLAGNPFGVSRVPPGSHDLPLLLQALETWRNGGMLRLPLFDKALADGAGDRAGWRQERCDALVLEGWLLGCRPLHESRLRALVAAQAGPEPGAAINRQATLPVGAQEAISLRPEEWAWLPRWNRELEQYLPLWDATDGLWLLRPIHWGLPRRWRFQAEARQRRSGGGWLPADVLDQLVRASLCSLPPALYQDPLIAGVPMDEDSIHGGALESTPQMRSEGRGPQSEETPRQWPAEPCPLDARGSDQGASCAWHDQPPVQAVAWLDGRRRCRRVWRQDSLSASSSATG
ncbi:MAG: hypothetical protein VKI83_12630 [Synechococcaceae cyanobacterium]|nr:hypothetical protein [Synechococcaceae cyanobacterium]